MNAPAQGGVVAADFSPRTVPDLRARLAPDGEMTIGLIGNSVWNERLGIGYGWELVEVMRELRDLPVRGVMIRSGTAVPILKAGAVEYRVADSISFIPQIPYDSVADYLSAIDICFSTQMNDVPGNVRTTGKFPLFLAGGRYILASEVGEGRAGSSGFDAGELSGNRSPNISCQAREANQRS